LALISLTYFSFLPKYVDCCVFTEGNSVANNEFRFGYLRLKSADVYPQTFQLLHLAPDQVLADQCLVMTTHIVIMTITFEFLPQKTFN